MKLKLFAGSTSRMTRIFVANGTVTTGAGLVGLTASTSGLTWYYCREGASATTSVTLTAGSLGTFSSGGFVAFDATHMPGIYEIGIPNACLAAGAKTVTMMLQGAASMVPVPIEIELDAINYQDGVRAGLSSLPTNNAGTGGGLGTLENNLMMATDVKAINGNTNTLSTWNSNIALITSLSNLIQLIPGGFKGNIYFDSKDTNTGGNPTANTANVFVIETDTTAGVVGPGSVIFFTSTSSANYLTAVSVLAANEYFDPNSGEGLQLVGYQVTASASLPVAAIANDPLTVYSPGIGGGISGPSSVTLAFVDAAASPVPAVQFSVVGQGAMQANTSGIAAFGLANGNYTVVAAPVGLVMFPGTMLSVTGSTSVTITGSAISISPPPSPSQATVGVLCVDGSGSAQAGITVEYQVADTATAPGLAFDGNAKSAISGTNGIATMAMELSIPYDVRRDRGNPIRYIAPSVSASVMLPVSLVGGGDRRF